MNWRPDDWGNPYRVDWPADGRVIFEQGASAMLSALLKWLIGKCGKHPNGLQMGDKIDNLHYKSVATYPEHRYLCPQCMAELKESGK